MKNPTKSSLKKKAWKLFSEYIRRKYADYKGHVKCVSCGNIGHWKNMQAGHFVDGRNNTVLFDEMLTHPQCYSCNIGRNGNKIQYMLFMKKTYNLTDEDLDRLDKKKHIIHKMLISDYMELIDKYSDALVGLDIRIAPK